MEKPFEILFLEAYYNLTLTVYNENFVIDSDNNRNTYFLNNDGKTIYLNLSGNQISDISILKDFTELTRLSLDSNEITDISILKKLRKLTHLMLAYNKISDISCLENLTDLLDIDLSETPISDISLLFELKNLKGLSVIGNNISSIFGINKLSKLSHLSLSFTQIDDISELIDLKELSSLWISGTNIVDYSVIQSLSQLRTLVANFSSLDLDLLNNLSKLTYLSLSNSNIKDISILKYLPALADLNLNNNKVSDLSVFKSLKQLKKLQLSQNRISDINQFEFIDDKPNLRITADGNPCFANSGIVLISKENHYNAIANELKKLEENKIDVVLPEKILLLGNHASGKSTLLDYLLQKKQPRVIKSSSTSTEIVKIENFPKVLAKGKLPKAIFYDFGGQDYYHGLYKAFLSNDSINLLLWNKENDRNQIREDKNGINTRDFSREYWLNQLKYQYQKNKQTSDTEPIILIQTHADKTEKKESKREAYIGDCEYFSIENEFYVALNEDAIKKSKVFNSSLVYLENSILELIKNKQKSVAKPIWYDGFLNYILRKKGRSFTMLSNIEKEYKRKKENMKFLPEDLDQLSKKGLILYYKNDNDLKDIAWLDPSKTVKFIHEKILSTNTIRNNKGIINQKEFETLVKDDKILKLLVNQKVIFLDDTDQKYIIPSYLPLTDDDKKNHELLTFDFFEPSFVLKFEHFIPMGIINQLICYYGSNPNKKLYWRDQLLFANKDKSCKVLIRLDFTNLEILVSVKGIKENINLDNIQKEIFRDIIDLYWDEKVGAGRQSKLMEKRFLIDNELDVMVAETIKEEEGVYESKIKSPNDMYISIDNKRFVHHKTLENENVGQKILTYKLKKIIETRQSVEVEMRIIDKDKSGEQPSILFKNFTTNKNIKKMKKIFISYSRKDFEFKDELKKHLNMLQLFEIADNWSCEEITIGKWGAQIQKELEESDLIIYMLSANFFSSQYIIEHEVKKAMDLINENRKKDILCVVVSEFTGLDKLKNATEKNIRSDLQNALLNLASHQYLPYSTQQNKVTDNNEELIIPLKYHPNIESALSKITEKVLEFIK